MRPGTGASLRGRNLIVRILKGRVNPGQLAAFRTQAQWVLRDIREQDGIVHAEVARQVHPDGAEETILVSVWRDFEAIYGWLGVTDILQTPTRGRGEPNVFEQFEVQHYEVVEDDELAAVTAEKLAAAADRSRRAAVALDF
jgi:heme-degrading monooxygenase HmoA